MNEQNHELPVSRIPETIFEIPSYQRGYRWTSEEIKALLNDLLEFYESPDETTYCLQPLVFQQISDNTSEGFKVVDGQQRLTTIFIILWCLQESRIGWDIKYTTEDNAPLLSDLIQKPHRRINDYFRDEAKKTVQEWLFTKTVKNRRQTIVDLLYGRKENKKVFFLRYDLNPNDDGQAVFNRLNAGKTPLTSSELIRALFMESRNGLREDERTDIAKEWDVISSGMLDSAFWSIWNTADFKVISTRMDFLFSIVAGVNPQKARHDPLLVYRRFEQFAKEQKGEDSRTKLLAAWEIVLRCWWWMQSCYADDLIYHRLGWLTCFTDYQSFNMFKTVWGEKAKHRICEFKKCLEEIIRQSFGKEEETELPSFDSFGYAISTPEELRKLFVLLNILEAENRHERFRFDLYGEGQWDIEHIASQTDPPLDTKENQELWIKFARDEMSVDERNKFDETVGTCDYRVKLKYIVDLFQPESLADINAIGNLALLDSGTNRGYKNAIFPVKRKWILEKRNKEKAHERYVLPCTAAVFDKHFSPGAAQMRYWGPKDAEQYRTEMKKLFESFMKNG